MTHGRTPHHHDHPKNRGMQWLVEARHPLVCAIDGETVLNQIVGADGEKIDLAGEEICCVCRRRDLDHDTNRHVGYDLAAPEEPVSRNSER